MFRSQEYQELCAVCKASQTIQCQTCSFWVCSRHAATGDAQCRACVLRAQEVSFTASGAGKIQRGLGSAMVGLSTGFTYLAFSYHMLHPVFLAVAVTVASLGAGLLGWSFVAPRLVRHRLEKSERGHRMLPAGRTQPLLIEASSLADGSATDHRET